jgi:hypothetical protein
MSAKQAIVLAEIPEFASALARSHRRQKGALTDKCLSFRGVSFVTRH